MPNYFIDFPETYQAVSRQIAVFKRQVVWEDTPGQLQGNANKAKLINWSYIPRYIGTFQKWQKKLIRNKEQIIVC